MNATRFTAERNLTVIHDLTVFVRMHENTGGTVCDQDQKWWKIYLQDQSDAGWGRFARTYHALVESRFVEDSTPFDELAQISPEDNVFLGCRYPTRKNPDAQHCHTALALEFMLERYPGTEIDANLVQ